MADLASCNENVRQDVEKVNEKFWCHGKSALSVRISQSSEADDDLYHDFDHCISRNHFPSSIHGHDLSALPSHMDT